jgi:hypothetical protein
LASMKQRLAALEKKSAEEGILLEHFDFHFI